MTSLRVNFSMRVEVKIEHLTTKQYEKIVKDFYSCDVLVASIVFCTLCETMPRLIPVSAAGM